MWASFDITVRYIMWASFDIRVRYIMWASFDITVRYIMWASFDITVRYIMWASFDITVRYIMWASATTMLLFLTPAGPADTWGRPRRDNSLATLKPILFKIFRPWTDLANNFESSCSKLRKIVGEILSRVETCMQQHHHRRLRASLVGAKGTFRMAQLLVRPWIQRIPDSILCASRT